jgi:hypothetical protein
MTDTWSVISAVIDQRVKTAQDEMLKSMRAGDTKFAARIDDINRSMSGACDPDTSKKTQGLAIPAHIADMLDALRASKPSVFEVLAQAGEELSTAGPSTHVALINKMFDRVLGS